MDEAILVTASLLVGAGAGALLTYAHDRSLLHLYGQLVQALSRRSGTNMNQEAPEAPAGSTCYLATLKR